jgi:NADH-quinone oxidoreductase subunit D
VSVGATIPLGPQHPALKEPLNFQFEVEGETVVSAKPRIGYAHRGVEKLAESKTFVQNIYLAERICGICSHQHALCYAQAVERILQLEPPPRARYIRLILHELERIHSHYLWLGLTAYAMGFETLFMYTLRDREEVMKVLEEVSGHRVNYGMVTLGGVRRDLDSSKVENIRKAMDFFERRTRYYKKLCETEPIVHRRCEGIGVLKPRDADELCAVGPTARASSVKRDVRADEPYTGYDEVPFNPVFYDGCDVESRILLRCDEVLESVNVIRYAVDHLPGGETQTRVSARIPAGEGWSRVEAPRGENFHYVLSEGGVRPSRLKVRTPTVANLLAMCMMLRGAHIADIPVIIAGVDPCIGCADRVAFVDLTKRRSWVWDGETLRRYGVAWYAG